MKLRAVLFAGVVPVLLSGAGLDRRVLGQTTGPTNPPLVISSMDGRDLFAFYCASCHGRDGKGGGPVVAALKTSAARSHHHHAAQRRHIPEDPRRVHGDRRWRSGDAGARLEGHAGVGAHLQGLDARDAMNKVRISNIVGYIQSVQSR